MQIERTEVATENRWNVEHFYPSLESWREELKRDRKGWAHLAAFRGTLAQGPHQIATFLSRYFEAEHEIIRLRTYAHLRHDEDIGEDVHKQAFSQAMRLHQEFQEGMAWVSPELLAVPQETMQKFLVSPELAPYRIYLEKIVRFRPHVLSVEGEEILAASGLALDAAERAFGAINNADLKFPKIQGSDGKTHELTHGTYLVHLRSQDRTLRKGAFLGLHQAFLGLENTFAELLQGELQKHQFFAKTRRFPSCLEAALFPHNIAPDVYRNLVGTVRANLPVLHKYCRMRKEALGVDELHLYDMQVSLVPEVEFKIPYPEAEERVITSVAPLGKEYQETLAKGLRVDRWVDRFENLRKRSGAYSSGCFGSFPYILMNYHGLFHDLMTLTHEAGHSMHSFLTWKNQPYHDADYPIFVAEVASTFHEELLFRALLRETTDPKRRAFLINQKLDDIRSTFFRQAMFAEFELEMHAAVEQGIPLTPTFLKEKYRALNAAYFGPDVVLDDEISIEWARIPHFYYNYYVYQYATGIAAAYALVESVEGQGPEKYLQFLASGGSAYPLDLLQRAGVDMRASAPLEALIRRFDELTEELKKILP